MIWRILPELHPLRSVPLSSVLPSTQLCRLSSVRLCRLMQKQNGHCRQLKPWQRRGDVAMALASHSALLTGQGPAGRLCCQLPAAGRDGQTRRLPRDRGASRSSWLPSRKQPHHLFWQQPSNCMCVAGGDTQTGTWCPRRCQTETTKVSLLIVMQQRGMVLRKSPRALRMSYRAVERRAARGWCQVEVFQQVSVSCTRITPLPHHELLRPKQPLLASKRLRCRSCAAACHPRCPAYRSQSLRHRARTQAQLAPCRGHRRTCT